MIRADDFNLLYEALGSDERAYDGELMLPHIERVAELIREKLKAVLTPP